MVCAGLFRLTSIVTIRHLFYVCVIIILSACDGSYSDLAESPPTNIDPTASFTVDVSTGEALLTVNFDASTSADIDGSISAYNWDFGDGTTGTGVVAEHTYTVNGAYLVNLTVTDNDGLTAVSKSRLIRIVPSDIAPMAVFTVDVSTGDEGLTVNFDAAVSADSDGNITSYDWNFGDGNSGVGKQVSHTYTLAGRYFVTLTVSDDNGAQAVSSAQAITVLLANVLPSAVFSMDMDSGDGPLTVNFDATSSSDPDGSIASYIWNFGDGYTAIGQTVAHTYTSNGIYVAFLTVLDNDGATNISVSRVIRVLPLNIEPGATFVVE